MIKRLYITQSANNAKTCSFFFLPLSLLTLYVSALDGHLQVCVIYIRFKMACNRMLKCRIANSSHTKEYIKTPEDGHLGPKHVVLKVKVEEKGTICCIIDGLCYT
jgi:hypothetical protein